MSNYSVIQVESFPEGNSLPYRYLTEPSYATKTLLAY